MEIITDSYNWVVLNKNWLFSGAGIIILNLLIYLFKKRRREMVISIKGKTNKNVIIVGNKNKVEKND